MTDADEALLWARRGLVELWESHGAPAEAVAAVKAGEYDDSLNMSAEPYRAGAAASAERIKELEAFLQRLREWDQMNPPVTGDHAAWAASIDRLLKGGQS